MSLKESNLQGYIFEKSRYVKKIVPFLPSCEIKKQYNFFFFFICAGATTNFLKAQILFTMQKIGDTSTVLVINSSD